MKDEVEQTIKEYLNGIFSILGEAAEVELQESDGGMLVNLKGVKTFEGKDQRTLSALSYLLELLVKRNLRESLRIYIDVDGYKRRRKEELKQFALEIAEKVKRERVRVRLNPMDSWERKAVHEALSNHESVRTYSEGQGEERRVIIEPTRR